ncbi:unnamed protein product, partial [Scytosiphon promiscuus]
GASAAAATVGGGRAGTAPRKPKAVPTSGTTATTITRIGANALSATPPPGSPRARGIGRSRAPVVESPGPPRSPRGGRLWSKSKSPRSGGVAQEGGFFGRGDGQGKT